MQMKQIVSFSLIICLPLVGDVVGREGPGTTLAAGNCHLGCHFIIDTELTLGVLGFIQPSRADYPDYPD